MAKNLGFIVILSMCLLIVELSYVQGESPSPVVSPEREPIADSPLPPPPEEDSPLPPSSSPEADSPLPPSSSPESDSPDQPPASSPEPESQADSPSPPPPPPPPLQPESPSEAPSPSPGQAPAPSDDDDDSDDNDTEPETQYFPSPTPSPAPEVGIPDDIKASQEGDNEEFDDQSGENNGMSGLKKAGIAIGAILGVGAIVIGALVYKKRKDNMTRARYTYFNEGEFL